MKSKTFDETLTEDQRRRAKILRTAARNDHPLLKHEKTPGAFGDTYDDCLRGDYVLLSRAKELRRKARAEIYWSRASNEMREIIRTAVLDNEPFKGNEPLTRWMMRRELKWIIDDSYVLNYIINYVISEL